MPLSRSRPPRIFDLFDPGRQKNPFRAQITFIDLRQSFGNLTHNWFRQTGADKILSSRYCLVSSRDRDAKSHRFVMRETKYHGILTNFKIHYYPNFLRKSS